MLLMGIHPLQMGIFPVRKLLVRHYQRPVGGDSAQFWLLWLLWAKGGQWDTPCPCRWSAWKTIGALLGNTPWRNCLLLLPRFFGVESLGILNPERFAAWNRVLDIINQRYPAVHDHPHYFLPTPANTFMIMYRTQGGQCLLLLGAYRSYVSKLGGQCDFSQYQNVW